MVIRGSRRRAGQPVGLDDDPGDEVGRHAGVIDQEEEDGAAQAIALAAHPRWGHETSSR